MSTSTQRVLKEKNLNPVQARRGQVVSLLHAPGKWQITDKTPNRPGEWWLVGWDAEARAHRSQWGLGYEAATAPEMTQGAA